MCKGRGGARPARAERKGFPAKRAGFSEWFFLPIPMIRFDF